MTENPFLCNCKWLLEHNTDSDFMLWVDKLEEDHNHHIWEEAYHAGKQDAAEEQDAIMEERMLTE